MAIDSAAKRFSMMGMGDGSTLIPPDGTISQPDRQSLIHMYSGITASNIVIVIVSSRVATKSMVQSLVKNLVVS